jgi:hypothetical protein
VLLFRQGIQAVRFRGFFTTADFGLPLHGCQATEVRPKVVTR